MGVNRSSLRSLLALGFVAARHRMFSKHQQLPINFKLTHYLTNPRLHHSSLQSSGRISGYPDRTPFGLATVKLGKGHAVPERISCNSRELPVQ